MDCYKWYVDRNRENTSDVVRMLKNEIFDYISEKCKKEGDAIDWSDMELALGQFTEKVPNEEFETLLLDIADNLKAVNRGLSSKDLPDVENRGFGIKTSKQMLINGLGGQYLMISGSCLYVKSLNLDSFYAMPDGLRWNGTIVALRIPYHSTTFNYINYIE